MLRVTDLRGTTPTTAELRRALPRGGVDVHAVLPAVTPIVEEVRVGGAEKALEYGEKFDGIRPASVRVPSEVIKEAVDKLDPALRSALEVAIERIRKVHAEQKPQPHTTTLANGATVTE